MAEPGRNLEELKQSLNLLKKALKSTRDEKMQVKAELSSAAGIVATAEQELKDKIVAIDRLNLVNQDLDHQIKKFTLLENLNENPKSTDLATDSRGFFILEQQNSKLQEDSEIYYQENQELIVKISQLEEENANISKNLLTSDDVLKEKIKGLRMKIEETINKTAENSKEKEELLSEVHEIRGKSEVLDTAARIVSLTVTELDEEHSNSKRTLEYIREYEKEIVDKLAFHIKLENEMAEELLKYRSIVAEARSSYQKFDIKRIWMVMTTNVTMVLQKGQDGKHVIQVTEGKACSTYKIADIDAVFMHPTKSNRFFLRTNADCDQEYESECAVKIMSLIRELIFSDFNGRD